MELTKEQIEGLHALTNLNRELIQRSGVYLCGYCQEGGQAMNIERWVDDNQTALCPKCGVDSLIPATIPHDIIEQFNEFWFS